MARTVVPLTNTQITSAKAEEKDYTLHDGGGLFLLVKTNKRKIWRFKYSRPLTKKQALKTYGPYPEISLAEARKMRDEDRVLLAKKIDPQEHRKKLEHDLIISKENTFLKIAEQWFKIKKTNISADYAKDVWRSLEKDVLPRVGMMSITDIKAQDMIKVITPVSDAGKLETVRRLCQRINEIMDYAINCGHIDANPCAKISRAFEAPEKNLMPSIPPQELPKLFKRLFSTNIEIQTKNLFLWQLLTMTRPVEAAATRWEEIDFNNKLWCIPKERMKKKRDHIIPLSIQCINILNTMKSISGHSLFVFPHRSNPSKSMNSQTINAAIKRAGFAGTLVAHGLRSIASTALNEHEFNPDAIEAALSHIDKNTVRRAYNRSDYLDSRKEIMQFWADYVTTKMNDQT
ncbi:tyrosine-type recombinase/integrase [Budviciaceae bacterium CWB-B4]|uniref:Tyrosine-type recombinase/integrase n=1 Tax=Limnobaculum xujianqingii TaxID=2738837 RepID=A0A9D7AG36_9GAMM|nr:integrase domain-containing protein [Limnobaculum xujianqingii]MBK5072057.1 tyrosine-type recombinase/integrase [Limnobaculum xujianqingii]MBK5175366.1 tyrosine-type recombinase/integrase [Limnobaculum xujianqingii]